jgi:hypothetical protein
LHQPGVCLTRTAEDVCDSCVRIDIQLARDDLPLEEREHLVLEKGMHLQAAIDQRRFMSGFVKQYIAANAPQQPVPNAIIPDTIDDAPPDPIDDAFPEIQIQIEDFGGSFPLPFYGHQHPSTDYFNSNLMMQNFIISDITANRNNVLIYDERGQGKGADALCSLRLFFHLRLRQERADRSPKMLLLILDNCIGQNKSKVVFMFYALLSLLFYDKVALLFLIPGHSHNQADRVVAWCRNKMRAQNLYTPNAIVFELNAIKSVSAEFLDHQSSRRPFFGDWTSLLKKYFKSMPPNYTGNYFFEIDQSIVSMRHLVSTPDNEAVQFPMLLPENIDYVRQAILFDLFGSGVKSINDVTSIDMVKLPRVELKEQLTNKKLKSLSKKYFSIPPEVLSYYPSVPEGLFDSSEDEDVVATRSRSKSVRVAPSKKAVGVEKPKVGRPRKNAFGIVPGQSSLLSFF